MTLPRARKRGGFVKPIQLSIFIRDQLTGGVETWGYDLYKMYKEAAQAIPTARKTKRKVISYNGFQHYLYVLRRLGLIEYVLTPEGEILSDTAHEKGGPDAALAPQLAPTRFFRAIPDRLNDPAWGNIWEAYREIR